MFKLVVLACVLAVAAASAVVPYAGYASTYAAPWSYSGYAAPTAYTGLGYSAYSSWPYSGYSAYSGWPSTYGYSGAWAGRSAYPYSSWSGRYLW